MIMSTYLEIWIGHVLRVLTGFQSSVYCGSHVVCQLKLSVGQDGPLC